MALQDLCCLGDHLSLCPCATWSAHLPCSFLEIQGRVDLFEQWLKGGLQVTQQPGVGVRLCRVEVHGWGNPCLSRHGASSGPPGNGPEPLHQSSMLTGSPAPPADMQAFPELAAAADSTEAVGQGEQQQAAQQELPQAP